MGNAFESIHFFQKMSYLIFFENPAFKIFHLSTHCGDPKSVATPEDLKYGARLCPYSSLPTVCSLIISENYKDSIKILSVLPFYPFPWEGRSSGSSHSVQLPRVADAVGADAFLWLLFPVQYQSVLRATPLPLAAISDPVGAQKSRRQTLRFPSESLWKTMGECIFLSFFSHSTCFPLCHSHFCLDVVFVLRMRCYPLLLWLQNDEHTGNI